MLMKVINDYNNDDPNPIELLVGDTVKLGETSNPNGPYPNWVFCTSERTGRVGWVAVHTLKIENGIGTALEAGTSKEMTVCAGDIIDTLRELNGWYWSIRKSDNETGWVAKDNLTDI